MDIVYQLFYRLREKSNDQSRTETFLEGLHGFSITEDLGRVGEMSHKKTLNKKKRKKKAFDVQFKKLV